MKRERAIIIINEQHKLLTAQERLLDEQFSSWDVLSVPAKGWTYDEVLEQCEDILQALELILTIEGPGKPELGFPALTVVFASPVPAMMVVLGRAARGADLDVCAFHNDRREAKELPDGRIVHTLSPEGWIIV